MTAISTGYKMTQFELVRALWAAATIRITTGFVAVTLAPVLFTAGHQLSTADVVYFAAGTVFAWCVMLLLLLRRSSELAVPTRVTLTDNWIMLQLPSGLSGARWRSFTKLESTRHFWLFRVDNRGWLIVPKRAFTLAHRASIDQLIWQVAHERRQAQRRP